MACSLKKRFENKETFTVVEASVHSFFFNHSSETICSRSQGAFLCHELFFDDINFMIMQSSAKY